MRTHRPSPEPLFVGIAEAARLTSVSPDHIRALIAAGTLPAARIGTAPGGVRGVWRIRRDDLITVFSGGRAA